MFYKKTKGEIIFDCCNYVLLALLVVVTLYPCYYVLVASVSDPVKIFAEKGLVLFPKGFSLSSYLEVLKSDQIWLGYKNTVFYVIAGGIVSVLMTVMAAFALTRKELPGKNVIMFLIMFTMYFSGGLIPTYINVMQLGLENSLWAVILPSAVSTYNLIVMRTGFAAVPDSLEEAAKIDGASRLRILWQIILPLSKATVAVVCLYYAVTHWNSWFNAMLYLTDRRKFPLQLILREILIDSDTSSMVNAMDVGIGDASFVGETVKYAVIIVSVVPILCVYPFIQKYFTKGVMIGAVKG